MVNVLLAYPIMCTQKGTFSFGGFIGISYLCPWIIKRNIMAVLNFTSREFRSRQAHVFDLADKGEKVIIRRNKKQAYTLVPVEDDDLTFTPELQAKIEKARAEIKEGKCITLRSREDIEAYFDSL